ncbi:hypothetical protein CQA72_29505, partial [Klebsiella pneumoniae]
GVFFASYQGFVNPTSFTFFESALILAIVVLGGNGLHPGSGTPGCSSPAIRGLLTRRRSPFLSRR